MENIVEGLRQSIHTKTRLKQCFNYRGGTITDDTPFEEYPNQFNIISYDTGKALSVSTVEELEALMTTENVGKFYKYTGETTDTYIQNAVYLVQDTEDPIIKEVNNTGKPISVDTAEEMTTLLVEENIGKVYKYVGVTDENYTNGQLYIVEEE